MDQDLYLHHHRELEDSLNQFSHHTNTVAILSSRGEV